MEDKLKKEIIKACIIFLTPVITGGIIYVIKKKCVTKNDVKKMRVNSKLKMSEDNNHTNNVIDIANNECDNKIRYKRVETDEKIRLHKELWKWQREYSIKGSTTDEQSQNESSISCWIKNFHSIFKMPGYDNIPLLKQVLDGCPEGFKEAMLFHLLTMTGALCFSRVRAKYNGDLHAPNLMTVVEGKQGSGKSRFDLIYKKLFSRIIEQDRIKTRKDIPGNIKQTVGINITNSKFIDMLAENGKVHLYVIETELSRLLEVSRSGRIGFIEFRKAFDNEDIEQFNKSKKSTQGRYPVYLNCTLTGTPTAVSNAFNSKEVNEGSARRFCFTVIPEPGAHSEKIQFPEGEELEIIRDKIDEWRSKYCFHHDPVKGDIPCDEYVVDLDYVAEDLEDWIKAQYQIYLKDKVEKRNEIRFGIAAVAFHCAIVLHMLAGNPDANQRLARKNVKQLTLYIADYCMERYLTRFVPDYRMDSANITDDQQNSKCSEQKKRHLTLEEILQWYPKRGMIGDDGKPIGYGTIAKHLGLQDKNIVRNAFKRYEKGLI